LPRDGFSFARVRTSDNDFVATRAVLIYCWRVNRLYFGDNLKWLRAGCSTATNPRSRPRQKDRLASIRKFRPTMPKHHPKSASAPKFELAAVFSFGKTSISTHRAGDTRTILCLAQLIELRDSQTSMLQVCVSF